MKKTEKETHRTHVGIHISDIDQTVSFYTKFFGVEPSKVKQGYAKFELESPALIISFLADNDKVNNNFGHLGIQVDSSQELNKKFEAVKAAGLEYAEENQVSCCYALQDKFWVTDPDGIRWEVYHFHEDVETNDPYNETECCKSTTNKLEEETCCEEEAQCC